MRNLNMDWCYEGGCTYIADADTTIKDEPERHSTGRDVQRALQRDV